MFLAAFPMKHRGQRPRGAREGTALGVGGAVIWAKLG